MRLRWDRHVAEIREISIFSKFWWDGELKDGEEDGKC
jgi:hypothetical protein